MEANIAREPRQKCNTDESDSNERSDEVIRIKRRLRHHIRLQREENSRSFKTGLTMKGQDATSSWQGNDRTHLSGSVGRDSCWRPESDPPPSIPFSSNRTTEIDTPCVNDDNNDGPRHLMMLELKVKRMRAFYSQESSSQQSTLSPQSVSLLPAATTRNTASSAMASTADPPRFLVPTNRTERQSEIRQRVRERLVKTKRDAAVEKPLINAVDEHDNLHRIEQPEPDDEAMASTRMLIWNARGARPLWRTQLKRDLRQIQEPPLLPSLSPLLSRSSDGAMEGGNSDASPRTTALTDFPSSSPRSQFPTLLPRSAALHPRDHSRSSPHQNQTKIYTVPTSPLPMMSSVPVRIQEQASVTATTPLRVSTQTPSLLSLSKTHTHKSRDMAISPRLSWETPHSSPRAPEHLLPSARDEVPALPTNTCDNSNMDNDGPSPAMMGRKRLVLHAIRKLGRDGHDKSLASLLLRPTRHTKAIPRARSIVPPSSPPPQGPFVVIEKHWDETFAENARNSIEEARAFLLLRKKECLGIAIPQVRDVRNAAPHTQSGEKSFYNESKETSSPFLATRNIEDSIENDNMLVPPTADFPYILTPSDLSSSSSRSSSSSSSSSSSGCDTTDSAIAVVNMQMNHKATSGRRKITQGLTMGKSPSDGNLLTKSPNAARGSSAESQISSDRQVPKRSKDNDSTSAISSATPTRKRSVLKNNPLHPSHENHGRSGERESGPIKLLLCRSHRDSNNDESNTSVAVRTRHSQEASAALTQNTDPVTEPSSGSSSSQGSTAKGRKDGASANYNKHAKWYVRPQVEDEHVNNIELDVAPQYSRQHKPLGRSLKGANETMKNAVKPAVMQMVFFDSIIQQALSPKSPTHNLAAVPEEDDDGDGTAEF